jgi:SAM-dependent methyltransferase
MKQEQDYREYYKSSEAAEEYDESSYGADTYASLLWGIQKSILVTFLVRMRTARSRIRYLDFACGTGRVAAVVEDFVDESYGVDISQAMLDRAATRTKHTVLVKGDVTRDENVIVGKFDLITVFRFVLNAQPELRDHALSRLCKAMSGDDSYLIFNMHTNKYSYAFVSWLWYAIFGQSESKDARRYMSRDDCIKIANNVGLHVIRVRGVGFVSGKLFHVFPLRLVMFIESVLSKVPLLGLLGTDLLFFCKRKGDEGVKAGCG